MSTPIPIAPVEGRNAVDVVADEIKRLLTTIDEKNKKRITKVYIDVFTFAFICNIIAIAMFMVVGNTLGNEYMVMANMTNIDSITSNEQTYVYCKDSSYVNNYVTTLIVYNCVCVILVSFASWFDMKKPTYNTLLLLAIVAGIVIVCVGWFKVVKETPTECLPFILSSIISLELMQVLGLISFSGNVYRNEIAN
jgi:magnesium-transporting ATPase (P-type)